MLKSLGEFVTEQSSYTTSIDLPIAYFYKGTKNTFKARESPRNYCHEIQGNITDRIS